MSIGKATAQVTAQLLGTRRSRAALRAVPPMAPAHAYSPLQTKDGELVGTDPKEAAKEQQIRELQSAYDDQRKKDPTLETSIHPCSSPYSYLAMAWLSPFMRLGAIKKLETSDIAELTPRENSENVKDRFKDVSLSVALFPLGLAHRRRCDDGG